MNAKQLSRLEVLTSKLAARTEGVVFKIDTFGDELTLWADNCAAEDFASAKFFMAVIGPRGGMTIYKNFGFSI